MRGGKERDGRGDEERKREWTREEDTERDRRDRLLERLEI